MIFTGPVDELLRLSLRQAAVSLAGFQVRNAQRVAWRRPAPVINYPNDNAYTRVTEFKYLTGQEHPKTTLVYEFAEAEGDPYYPVPRPENAALYKRYQELAEATPGVHFLGRLGTYKYYNMDQVVAQALTLYARLTGVSRREIWRGERPS